MKKEIKGTNYKPLKHKIRGTFEVTFDTNGLPQFENSSVSQAETEELHLEWLHDGTELIRNQLVPLLNADSVTLTDFEICQETREENGLVSDRDIYSMIKEQLPWCDVTFQHTGGNCHNIHIAGEGYSCLEVVYVDVFGGYDFGVPSDVKEHDLSVLDKSCLVQYVMNLDEFYDDYDDGKKFSWRENQKYDDYGLHIGEFDTIEEVVQQAELICSADTRDLSQSDHPIHQDIFEAINHYQD